jgi:hypothetical protein
MDLLKETLGDKFKPEAEYQVVKHQDGPRLRMRGHKQVGEVPDSSPNQDGTMLVFEMTTKPLGVRHGDL